MQNLKICRRKNVILCRPTVHLNSVMVNFTEFKKYLKIHEFHWILNVKVLNSQSMVPYSIDGRWALHPLKFQGIFLEFPVHNLVRMNLPQNSAGPGPAVWLCHGYRHWWEYNPTRPVVDRLGIRRCSWQDAVSAVAGEWRWYCVTTRLVCVQVQRGHRTRSSVNSDVVEA